jgi:hypothetical protein
VCIFFLFIKTICVLSLPNSWLAKYEIIWARAGQLGGRVGWSTQTKQAGGFRPLLPRPGGHPNGPDRTPFVSYLISRVRDGLVVFTWMVFDTFSISSETCYLNSIQEEENFTESYIFAQTFLHLLDILRRNFSSLTKLFRI